MFVGVGGFGKVYLGGWKDQDVAIKIQQADSTNDKAIESVRQVSEW